MEKTNVMRLLSQKKIPHEILTFETDVAVSGEEIAKRLNLNPGSTFKTLVTVGKSGNHYVFMVPVLKELNLKKAAKAVGEKNIEMIKSKELLPLTGYVHGGCSPIGMKKLFTTTIHKTASDYEKIVFSAGKIGYHVMMTPDDLKKAIPVKTEDITD